MAFWSLTLSILKLQPDSVKAVRMGTIPIPGIGHQHQPPGTPPPQAHQVLPLAYIPFPSKYNRRIFKNRRKP